MQERLETWIKAVKEKEKNLEKNPDGKNEKQELEKERATLNIEIVLGKFLLEEKRLENLELLDEKKENNLTFFNSGRKGTKREFFKKKKENNQVSKECSYCKKSGHVYRVCPSLKCYNCQGQGHKAANCPSNKNRSNFKGKYNGKVIDRKNDIENGEKKENINTIIDFSGIFSISSEKIIKEKWVIDSGASSHIITDRNFFTNILE